MIWIAVAILMAVSVGERIRYNQDRDHTAISVISCQRYFNYKIYLAQAEVIDEFSEWMDSDEVFIEYEQKFSKGE